MSTRPATRRTRHDLVVVDASLAEHGGLIDRCERESARVTLTNTGLGALRLVPSHCDADWLVGAELPDMTGPELIAMLHEIEPRLRARLVAPRCGVDEELEAYRRNAQPDRTTNDSDFP